MTYNPWGAMQGIRVKRPRTSSGWSDRTLVNLGQARGFGGVTKQKSKQARRKYGRTKTFQERVRGMEPAKHNTINDSTAQATLTHQTIFTRDITQNITQGDGNANRDGDAIFIEAVKLNGFYQTAAATGAYQCRVLLGWSGEEYTIGAMGAGLTAAEVFLPNTGANWAAASIINPKAFTVLYDTTIVINSLTANAVDLESFQTTVPIKKKFSYQSAASVYGKVRNLYLVVVASVNGGTPASTAAGVCGVNIDTIFKPF